MSIEILTAKIRNQARDFLIESSNRGVYKSGDEEPLLLNIVVYLLIEVWQLKNQDINFTYHFPYQQTSIPLALLF